jgi:threonylcarbamoyladenosine tRNA methylthiotransferase MtaB
MRSDKSSVKFYTLGCKANQYDTQEIRERFLEVGFREVGDNEKADICVINTCTVTHRADKGSLYYIRRSRQENPQAGIIVTGCFTELDSVRISRQPGVRLIVKNKDKGRILQLLNQRNKQRKLTKITKVTKQTNRGISYFKGHTRAFLKIQDGCNNLCAYCKVPLVRGCSQSRPLNEILRDARRLVKNGFKEIVLTGICLGAFGKDLKPRKDLVDVINSLEKIPDLLRIRLSSIEAGDVSDKLIRKFSRSDKLCRHLHIPVQSGDDEILKKMNRRYSCQDYLGLIRKIKSVVLGIAITTDVLVGFPGEKKKNFLNTVKLIKQILPLRLHIFPYSPREHTPAYNFKDRPGPAEVKKRILCLSQIARECADIYQKKFLGKEMRVLIEGKAKANPGFWEGYTDNYIRVLVKSANKIENKVLPVRLKAARAKSELVLAVAGSSNLWADS